MKRKRPSFRACLAFLLSVLLTLTSFPYAALAASIDYGGGTQTVSGGKDYIITSAVSSLDTSDFTSSMKWTYSNSGTNHYFTFNSGGTYYLTKTVGNTTTTLSGTPSSFNAATAVGGGAFRLKRTVGGGTDYYLQYSSGFSFTTSSASVYLFDASTGLPAASLTDGSDYLIASGSSGAVTVLTHTGTGSSDLGTESLTVSDRYYALKSNLSSVEVTVSGGEISAKTGSLDDIAAWTATASGGNFTLKNGVNYLRNNSGTLQTSTTSTAWTISGGSVTSGSSPTRYLTGGGGGFTLSTAANAKILFFEKMQVYAVTYKANGGTGSDVTEYKTDGTDYDIAANTFTAPAGKAFLRWNTLEGGSGTDYAPSDTYAADADLILFAQWCDNYAVTLTAPSGVGASWLTGVDASSYHAKDGTDITFTVTGLGAGQDGGVPTYTVDGDDTVYYASFSSGSGVYTIPDADITGDIAVTVAPLSSSLKLTGGTGSGEVDAAVLSGNPLSANGYGYRVDADYTDASDDAAIAAALAGYNPADSGHGNYVGYYVTDLAFSLIDKATGNAYPVTGAELSEKISVTMSFPDLEEGIYYYLVLNHGGTLEVIPYGDLVFDFVNKTITFEIDKFSYVTVMGPASIAITYVVSGGTWTDPDPAYVTSDGGLTYVLTALSGTYVERPDDPTPPAGTTFVGWYTQDATRWDYAINSFIDDTALTARYAVSAHSVTYHPGAGAAFADAASLYVADGESYTVSGIAPTLANRVFLGWDTSSAAAAVVYASGATIASVTADVGLYAVWGLPTFTVAFDANGGVGAPDAQIKTFGTDLTLTLSEPTWAGHTFEGWATSSGGAVAYLPGDSYTAEASIRLYAAWTVFTYTVTFNGNGGNWYNGAVLYNGTVTNTKTYGEAMTINGTTTGAYTLARTGYTFMGWAVTSGGSAAYAEGAAYAVNASVTLYAVWQLSIYTVTLNGGDGCTVSPYGASTSPVAYDGSFSFTVAVSTGYDGSSMVVKANGVTLTPTAGVYTITHITTNQNVTVEGVAILTYTVTFNPNGGTSGAVTTLTKLHGVDMTITASVVPTRAGYLFLGWSASAGATEPTYETGASYTGNAAVTLYAVWKDDRSIVVSFDTASGIPASDPTGTVTSAAPANQTVKVGGRINEVADPTSTYYTFEGWYYTVGSSEYRWNFANTVSASDAAFTGITGTLTLRAKWRANYYTVTFNASGNITSPADIANVTYTGAGTVYIVKGCTAAKPADPTCSSTAGTPAVNKYTFYGWQTATGNDWEFTTPVTEDMTLSAFWIQYGYLTVTYNWNDVGGTVSTLAFATASDGFATISSAPGAVREGYSFEGWYASPTFGGTSLSISALNGAKISGNVSLYACWTAQSLEFITATAAHMWSGAGVYKDYFSETPYLRYLSGSRASGLTLSGGSITWESSADVTFEVDDDVSATSEAVMNGYGLYLDHNTGTVYGAPTVSDLSFNITVKATNSGENTKYGANGATTASVILGIAITDHAVSIDLGGTYPNSKIYGQDDAAYNGQYITVSAPNGVSLGSVTDKTVAVTYSYGAAVRYIHDAVTPASCTDTFTVIVNRTPGETVGSYKLYLDDTAGTKILVSGTYTGTATVKSCYTITVPGALTDTAYSAAYAGTKYAYTIAQRAMQIDALRDSNSGAVTLTKIYGESDGITMRQSPASNFAPAKDDAVTGDYGLVQWTVTDINGTATVIADALGGHLWRAGGEDVTKTPFDLSIKDGAGAYTVTVTDGDTDKIANYAFLTDDTGTLAITPLSVTIESVRGTDRVALAKTYGEDDGITPAVAALTPLVAATLTDVAGNVTVIADTFGGAVLARAYSAPDDVGVYGITLTSAVIKDSGGADCTENYLPAIASGSQLTINARAVIISASYTTSGVPATGIVPSTAFTASGRINRTVQTLNGNVTVNDSAVTASTAVYQTALGATAAGTYKISDLTLVLNSGTMSLTSANYTVTDAIVTVSQPYSGGGGSVTTYTVTFNSNGGSAVGSKSVTYGKTVAKPADPTRDGFSFDGWYTDEDLTKPFSFSTAITKDITLYAGWTALKSAGYTDIEDSWAYESICYVIDNGLMNGLTDTLFGPQGTMTRAMLVTVLYRMAGSPAVPGASGFTDVPAGQWYSDAVAWAVEAGIINGYSDTLFGALDAVTREQMTAIFFRYAAYLGYDTTASGDLSAFTDAGSVSGYALPAMQWAVGCGLINGRTETSLEPAGTSTRAEVAVIMVRFLTTFAL